MSVGCDGVGGILNGGDDEMVEEGQHGRSDAATIIMVVSKSKIGGPVRKQWKFPPRAHSGPPGEHVLAVISLADRYGVRGGMHQLELREG